MPFAAKVAVLIAVIGSVARIGYQIFRLRHERRAIEAIMRETGQPDPVER